MEQGCSHHHYRPCRYRAKGLVSVPSCCRAEAAEIEDPRENKASEGRSEAAEDYYLDTLAIGAAVTQGLVVATSSWVGRHFCVVGLDEVYL